MINLHKSYVAKLEFELASPGFVVRCTTNSYCTIDPRESSIIDTQNADNILIYLKTDGWAANGADPD